MTRILFLLDGSGSMAEEWEGKTKFQLARELLEEVVDSVAREDKPVEFALRVFGHQSPREIRDCEDSRLEVPFGRGNAREIRAALARVTPQGWTPIAYSLFLAAHDFPPPVRSGVRADVNAIVLITDGLENCDGDPCASSEALRNRRIALKPFIIGLGLPDEDQAMFDCVGTFFDAADERSFDRALGVVVSQALKNTTVQLNLLDQLGRATETDVEVTFYDAYTGTALDHVVHSMLRGGVADTLRLDPSGRYDITAHTTPPVSRQNIELVPGKHNVIALDVPQGNLDLMLEGHSRFTDIRCLVREPGTNRIVYVQNFNTRHRYIAGTYDLELLTLPRQRIPDFQILPGLDNTLRIPQPGRLLVQSYEHGILSVYVSRQGRLEQVHEWKDFSGKEALDLQPGEYTLVFRPSANKKVDMTRERKAVVYGGKSTTLSFER